jgi:glycerol-3-phosphate acyltransferase PlsY
MATVLVILLLSYLVGSIPGSVWTGQLMHGVDVREHGSGNAGATNVFRVLGWKAGVAASVIDLGKGLVAAGVVATQVRLGAGLPHWGLTTWEAGTVMCLAAGLAAIVGHMYPVWARFRGGKGVNTTAGVLLALTPGTTLIALGVFVAVLVASRYVSVASMTAAVAFPSAVAIDRYLLDASLDASLLVFGLVAATGIIVAHRSNIRRLVQGNENRVRSFSPAKGRLNQDGEG